MEFPYILLLGIGTGMFFGVLSMFLIGSQNSRDYPVGGIMPLVLVVFLPADSKLALAGMLFISGLLGFNLMVYFRRGQAAWNALVSGHGHDDHGQGGHEHNAHATSHPEPTPATSTGKSLADYL